MPGSDAASGAGVVPGANSAPGVYDVPGVIGVSGVGAVPGADASSGAEVEPGAGVPPGAGSVPDAGTVPDANEPDLFAGSVWDTHDVSRNNMARIIRHSFTCFVISQCSFDIKETVLLTVSPGESCQKNRPAHIAVSLLALTKTPDNIVKLQVILELQQISVFIYKHALDIGHFCPIQHVFGSQVI